MAYQGNPTLSADVQQRILDTFEQTLDLAGQGSRQEALLGCDFVLRLDPQFEPARVLQDRLRNSAGAVEVNDLRVGGPPAPAFDPFGDLEQQNMDLPAFTLEGPEEGLAREFQDLLAARRFQDVLNRAHQEQAVVAGSAELQQVVNLAQERLEGEPYLNKFLTAARQAAITGQTTEVARLLEKAKALDPSHPDIARLEAASPAPSMPPAFGAPAGRSAGENETDQRIRSLIAEGQTALDAGDPQGAIDAWSRIFLIDIDHQEAARLIESARRLKAERERQVEEIFHEGLAHLDAGATAKARQAFQQVLQIQPSYLAAREYLDQIDAGKTPSGRPAPHPAPTGSMAAVLPLSGDRQLSDDDVLKEEILVPPEPSEGGGVRGRSVAFSRESRPKGKGAKEARGGKLFYLVGGGVLVVLLAAGGYLLLNRDTMFPNSSSAVSPTPSAAIDPIARAEGLHKAGKTPIAIAQLRRVPESDPNYARAQELIAEWEGRAAQPQTTDLETEPAPVLSPELLARREGLLASARAAFGERSYFRALSRLREANEIARLGGEDAQMRQVAETQLARLAAQLNLFYDHEWQFALPDLWRRHEENPADRDVTHLIVDCYYNLAVRDLQRADTRKAAENLKEAAKLEPSDPILGRHIAFAETYQTRDKDLLYRIYVKYLPTR